MSSILSLSRLPSQSPPFVFSDPAVRKILSAASSWFIHSRGTGRVYGPFRTSQKSGRTVLNGSWRRGVPAGKNFYISLSGKSVALSPGQEKCLISDLEVRNRPQIVPDVWLLGLSGKRLRISIVAHKPSRTVSRETIIDVRRLRNLSAGILSSLLVIRRSGLKAGLADLKTDGRNLLRTVIPDRDLVRLLETTSERTLLLIPDRTLFSCPLEFLHDGDFLCLTRPVSRTAEDPSPIRYVPCPVEPEVPVFQVLYAGSGGPPSASAGIPNLFRRFRKDAELRLVTGKTFSGAMSRPGSVHFIGHGTVKSGSYAWQGLDKSNSFSLLEGRTPGFIFSHACNRAFFTPVFAETGTRLLASGTTAWVGAWSDIDLDSPAFAESFYPSFLNGASAAESVLLARRDLLSRGWKDSLLFGCWGDPMKKFAPE